MSTTRTPGISVLADGPRFIDKRYLGVRIGPRIGALTQEQAEERVKSAIIINRLRPGGPRIPSVLSATEPD